MTKIKFVIASAVLVFGVVVFLVMQQEKLCDENRALREQVGQMTQLKAENERLLKNTSDASDSQPLSNNQLSELLKLRGEVGVLREQKKELEKLRTAAAASAKSPEVKATLEVAPQDNFPKETWAFAGYATPEATLQTWNWAMSKGEVKAALDSVSAKMRIILEEDFEGKTDSQLATEGARQSSFIVGYQIVGRKVISEDEMVLRIAVAKVGKTMAGESNMKFKRINNEWKIVVPGD